jgi:hypothetical protein
MHDIIEHYGKVIIALFAIVAALAIAAIVVTQVTTSTKKATNDLDTKYEGPAKSAVDEGKTASATP